MAHTAEEVVETASLGELGQQLRVDSIQASTEAGSGHATSSMSAADLMAVLMARYLCYDFDDPDNPANDRLIFSKGHASPLLYSMFKAAGVISDEELMSFRTFGSRFEGHPTPRIEWVDVATGSLGQGFPIGVGFALASKYLDTLPARTWVLCGDSEMAEGSMWEAFHHASFYNLGNLTAILDMNRLGQTKETMDGWNGDHYVRRAAAFGWQTVQIDGHDPEEIDRAYSAALEDQSIPTLIVARTAKGRGVSFLEDAEGLHGKPVPTDQEGQAIEELGGERNMVVAVAKPETSPARPSHRPTGELELPGWEVGDSEATRTAYGETITALGHSREDIAAMDGEVSDSTRSGYFAADHPERYFEMYISEQQMISAAVALSARGYAPFASSFAAFHSRAYDFIRMGAISRANLRLCGSHAGCSIGEDGPSQMALEDMAMMRAVHGSTVLHPCDANQTAHLTAEMADRQGIVFLRTLRPKTEVIYSSDERFPIGSSRTLRSSNEDRVTIVAAGITVHEALSAADELADEGVSVRVIDAYSVKPIDAETLREAVAQTGGNLVVVEDHWPQGGLGEAVLSAVSENGRVEVRLRHLAVEEMPGSGSPRENMDSAGITARHVKDAARELAKG